MPRSLLAVLASFLFVGITWAQEVAPDLKVNAPASAKALDPKLPSLFIAGDSTAAKSSNPEIQGWGVPFIDLFDPAKINVVNLARGGRSSRTFITEGLWDQLLAQVKTGDFVLIQFGHNDSGAINAEPPGSTRPLRARGSLPGLGEESEEIDNVLTKKHETVHTYGWYMRKMISDTRAKGAFPILLSLTLRNIWKDGHVERASGNYRAWTRQLADANGVPFVDLSRILADQYEEMGEERLKAFFGPDHTHTSAQGAANTARAVLSGLKGLKLPWDDFLTEEARAVEKDSIGWLNLPEPVRPDVSHLFLVGDSTVRNGRGDGAGGQWGWGDYLDEALADRGIEVVNRAVGGLSSRTFITQGHWKRAKALLRAGDTLLIQFGHNDSSPVNDDKRARGTIAGTGEETQEIDNILTKAHEVVHTYGWYLRQYVREAKALGVKPVICSPVPRKKWVEGKIQRSQDTYGGWARAVAQEEGIPFIDLNERIAARYDAMGETAVTPLFADENTHTSQLGAQLNAAIVAEELRAQGLVPSVPPRG